MGLDKAAPGAAGGRGRRRAVAGQLVLLVVSGALALTVADFVVRFADLGFRPIRSRASEEAELVRAEFRTRVVTNALGFREHRLPSPKPAGTMRVVAIGDSFTQGYGVEDTEAFPRLLERLLDAREPTRRHEVFNLGVPGACPRDYLGNLRDVGLAYEPDVVIVGLMANDVNDMRAIREYGGRMLSAVLRDVQMELTDARPLWKRLPSRLWPSLYDYAGARLELSSRNSDAHAAEQQTVRPKRPVLPDDRWREVLLRVAERYGRRQELKAELARRTPEEIAALQSVLTGDYQYEDDPDERPMLKLMALIQPRVFADMVLLTPDYDAAWAETTRVLRRIDAAARRAGARTVITFIPAAYQVSAKAWRTWVEAGFTADPRTLSDTTFVERLSRFGAAAGVPVIDLLAPLRARATEDVYFPIDGHWTPRGHRLAAEVLAAAIIPDAADAGRGSSASAGQGGG